MSKLGTLTSFYLLLEYKLFLRYNNVDNFSEKVREKKNVSKIR